MIAQAMVNAQAENLEHPEQLTRAENQIFGASVGLITAVVCLAGTIASASRLGQGGTTIGLIICTVASTAVGVPFLSAYLYERRNPQAIPQAQTNLGDVSETRACTPVHTNTPSTPHIV